MIKPLRVLFLAVPALAVILVIWAAVSSVPRSSGGDGSEPTLRIPDVDRSVRSDGGLDRDKNEADEYALLARYYGYPDSISSSEDESKPAPIPNVIVWYAEAHVKISLVKIGCVRPFLRGAEVVADLPKYPSIARDFQERMRSHPCEPTHPGWTIMGYLDSLDNQPISAQRADDLLASMTHRRTSQPRHE